MEISVSSTCCKFKQLTIHHFGTPMLKKSIPYSTLTHRVTKRAYLITISKNKSQKDQKLKQAARVYESIGDLYKFRRNLKESEKHYKLAIENHKKNKDSLGEARAMNLAGDLYMDREDFPPAGNWYFMGLVLVIAARYFPNGMFLYFIDFLKNFNASSQPHPEFPN